MTRVAVIGAGAWGTALAQRFCLNGAEVVLWAREPEVVTSINARHVNADFLADIPLDPALRATGDIASAASADVVVLAAPAQHLRAVGRALAAHLTPATPALICAKGLETATGKLMSEVVGEVLPHAVPAILSGPTFAHEVARGQPTAVTLAVADPGLGARLVELVGSRTFRPYLAGDLVGAQVGGAVKNVLAIACGIVAGRGLGDNARAALVTRGLTEMLRFGRALGGREETLMGLSGLGDLVLTCTGTASRNYSLGAALGKGASLTDYLGGRRSVAEGVYTAGAVVARADRLGVEMPIAAAVDAVVNREAGLADTIESLLSRPFRTETDNTP